MLAFRLAFKNLLGAGLKTWLNVIVLSMAFVIIIFYNSLMDGWNKQAVRDSIDWEIGQGQLWHHAYDPFDPFTISEAHAAIPSSVHQQITDGHATPVLLTQASIYPQGRLQSIVLKGIDPEQKILSLPTAELAAASSTIPAMIGQRMAEATKLHEGDRVLLRWRDKNNTFDATEIVIEKIFDTNVQAVDNGQVWIPLQQLQTMTGLEGEATLIVAGDAFASPTDEQWTFKNHETLLADLDAVIAAKKGGASVMYLLLLGIALLAIFDTQVFSIFRRQKEIGTYIALGMTRAQVVKLFTIEGGAHSLLAALVGTIYGTPLFWYLKKNGVPLPEGSDDAGIPISAEIIPEYGLGLILSTVALVVISATIVSYLPSRKIAKMQPTEALRGRALG